MPVGIPVLGMDMEVPVFRFEHGVSVVGSLLSSNVGSVVIKVNPEIPVTEPNTSKSLLSLSALTSPLASSLSSNDPETMLSQLIDGSLFS